MNNVDPRSLIGTGTIGVSWRIVAKSLVNGQAYADLQQYINAAGTPTELYRTVYGLEQKDWDNRVKAQENYQSIVLHQWNCAGFND